MEVAQSSNSTPTKRKNNIKSEDSPKNKKIKSYSAKEFRKKLNSSDKLIALQEFLNMLEQSSDNSYCFDYLDNGGNILELLQILENDSAVPPTIVFSVITHLLLRINANYVQFHNSSYEACRYLLNNYLPVVHKMIGMSSSKEERKVCLKLLTSMVTLSPNLAKDVLLNVKFHTPNIELLTKHTGEKDYVRDSFIHFLTGFLIDSEFQTLQILLKRSYLFTSIIAGLKYDAANTVCIVLAAMKNYILQNNSVMKTTKMHVFNTAVVRDIVNLYNWKGPEGLKSLKNNTTAVEVDKVAKSKVNECVHDLLLVLCTNHKYGVIFRDSLVGLGHRNQNGLMYTVLNSLDRPWEHSYASELVIKICQSCPDLAKHMWTILKPFLEPRLSDRWLKAVEFAKKLLDVLQPQCIEHCAADLNPRQLAQIIEILVSPAPIVNALFPGDVTVTEIEVKQHIYEVILEMLRSIGTYLAAIENWMSSDNCKKVKNTLSNFITRNYPSAQKLISDWEKIDTEEKQSFKLEFLKSILDILKLYQNFSPQFFYDFSSVNFNITKFFGCLPEDEIGESLKAKIIDVFVDIDYSYFLPESEIFSYSMSLLLKSYHKQKTEEIRVILNKILKNTDIFEGCFHEIDIWSNGIFNLNNLTDSFVELFVLILKNVSKNIIVYQEKLSSIEFQDKVGLNDSVLNIFEDNEDITYQVKHNHFSVLTLGFLEHLQENETSKSAKKFLEFVLLNIFHSQTIPSKYFAVVQMYRSVVPGSLFEYLNGWASNNPQILSKMKGSLTIFAEFSENFVNANKIKDDFFSKNLYPGFYIDFLHMSTFYFTNLVESNAVTCDHSESFILCIDQLIKQNIFNNDCFEIVLGNPNMVNNFNVRQSGKETANGICTRTVYKVVQMIHHLSYSKMYTSIYAQNIFNSIMKVLKKSTKYSLREDIEEYLNIFPLSYIYCTTLIERILQVIEHSEPAVLNILSYSISRMAILYKINPSNSPLDQNSVSRITRYMVNKLKQENDCSNLSRSLLQYFDIFPYSITFIDENLFPNLLKVKEFNKDNADLAVFLCERNPSLIKHVQDNIEFVAEKKGLILPITHILVKSSASKDILKLIYDNLETSLIKALQKPQKVGQHFLKNYDINILIESFMPVEKCKQFIEKVQKFEVTEVFHVYLIEAVYNKLFAETELTEKQISNAILTFVHFEMTLFKKKSSSEDSDVKILETTIIFDRLLEKILSKYPSLELKSISTNETYKTFCKFALKFGISGQHVLLAALRLSVRLLASVMDKEQAGLLMEMLLSHSEFLNVILGEHTETKLEVLKLLLFLSEHWSEFIEKSHVALVLSAYRGLVTRCDRTILKLLKFYESKADQTAFYDFKPFLWGRAAATHYSVRNSIENSLNKQPKINDVLGVLKEDLIHSTIKYYPLKDGLNEDDIDTTDSHCYDLKFLLPLFSHLLAPEQQVKTYVFTRSGALSLTVIGLSSQDKEVRQAACHVLSRFYFHLEARQTGKDSPLWIRFVEAVCRGAATLPNSRLNNFAAIFFARMSLILTYPKQTMFAPLSSYLSAKQDLDLSTIPELYTLFFSSEVDFKQHRNFILEVVKDGLRTERDFLDFLKSMAPKLFLELFSSSLVDVSGKLLILEVLQSTCKIPLGVKMMCENYALLSQLYNIVHDLINAKKNTNVLLKILQIFLDIVKVRIDERTSEFVFDLCLDIARSEIFIKFNDKEIGCFYEVVYKVFKNNAGVVRSKESILVIFLDKSDDIFSKYLQKYGCNYVKENCYNLQTKDKYLYLRLLIFDMLK